MKVVVLAALGIGVSLGAPAAPDKPAPNAPAVAIVTQTQVENWTHEWQKRLDLLDWHVAVQIVRASDLKPDTLGNLRWNSGSKTATIRVLNPADYDLAPADIPSDIEYTIVHELIHLNLAGLPHSGASPVTEERVVNKISEALFALEKGGSYRPRNAVIKEGERSRSSSEASRSHIKP